MKSLIKLQAVMDEFTNEHYKITANMIAIFCFIAANSDKVITTRDLPEELGLPQTTVNRLIRTMADRSYTREEGFKWLRQTVDPLDERQRIVEVTAKGRKLANRLREILENDK
jgi:DNA-binding MarR family transcriptional regulator|tara:strand:+ start:2314 stop:2652 length:339 start_codon:yes stop_codon:yes gene_type:complete